MLMLSPPTTHHLCLQVRVLVPQSQVQSAAKKVGTFCQKLLPHVLMKKG